jgi:hypothetical protein
MTQPATPPTGGKRAETLIDELEWDALPELTSVRAAELIEDLVHWWCGAADDEIRRTLPKVVEYGATDLVDIGRDLAACMDRQVTDQEAAELGIYFYVRGKLARWTDAIKRGKPVSDDTLFDLGIYIRMAQRVRQSGGWPRG